MAYLGGDITEITCNHPTLGGFTFTPKSGEAPTVDYGGYRNNDDQDSIAANGRAIRTKTLKQWMLEQVCAWDVQTDEDLKKVNDLASSTEESTWTFSHLGATWKGEGTIVGDVQGDSNAATFTLKVAGGNKLKKIA